MKQKRPLSSNIYKNAFKKPTKLQQIDDVLDDDKYYKSKNNKRLYQYRPKTSNYRTTYANNIFMKNHPKKLDVLNLMIETNQNQFNYNKIKNKFKSINPLYIRGTEENLKRPNFNQNTEELFYRYNLLYGADTNNIIRTYSPKMRPMSASINSFNKKMVKDLNESESVFDDAKVNELLNARCKDIGIEMRENMIYKFRDYCDSKCKNRISDLSELYLGMNSINVISSMIFNGDKISRLNLSKNNIGDGGLIILVNALKHNSSILSLNLTSNAITHKGGTVFFRDLADHKSLIDINISSIEGINRNRLTALGITHIENFLQKNIFIEKLNISSNSLKDDGFILVSKGLENNQSLITLNISNNDIRPKGLYQGLSQITLCKIYSLNISNNPLLNDGIKLITDSLKNFINLRKLNISNCKFEFPGFEYLLNVLQNMKRIEYLNVSRNNLRSKNFENVSFWVKD